MSAFSLASASENSVSENSANVPDSATNLPATCRCTIIIHPLHLPHLSTPQPCLELVMCEGEADRMEGEAECMEGEAECMEGEAECMEGEAECMEVYGGRG